MRDFDGPIVMIGVGVDRQSTLPLIERHIASIIPSWWSIAPDADDRRYAGRAENPLRPRAVTKANYRELLTPCFAAGPDAGMHVNLSIESLGRAGWSSPRDKSTPFTSIRW